MTDKIKDNALIAAKIADDKKGQDIQVLDVKELTIIADYFVICSGKSETQVKAIARAIEDGLAEEGIYPQRVAGKQESRWILLDFADFIVHIFHQNEREFYELERLWADAEKILQKENG